MADHLVPHDDTGVDERFMRLALAEAAASRYTTSPNPWVGSVVVADGQPVGLGATQPPGGAHAEIGALAEAGARAAGATLYTTLEPCSHHGRTPPCVDAIVDARIARVVIGVLDPDPSVAGQGIVALRAAGCEVTTGVGEADVEEQLRAYLHHRRSGRPYVVLKLASTLDGRTGAPDATSKWITGLAARVDVHRIRAESDAVVVGAGTVREDDPSLTVRDFRPADAAGGAVRDPRRIVLGRIPDDARVRPATEHVGALEELLDELGADGVLQVLVEGGATVAGAFHRARLVDEYVLYLAPALLGGDDGPSMLAGHGASTMADVLRGRFVSIDRLGDDVRLVFRA